MPELPEVETICRGLAPDLAGRRIGQVELRRAGLRRPFPPDLATRLTGQRIGTIGRRAKYLLFDFEAGERMVIHLGMSGRLTLAPANGADLALPDPAGALYFVRPPNPVHDHVRFHFPAEASKPGLILTFNDPRRFGDLALASADTASFPALAGLGPEPLGEEFTGAVLHARLKARKSPVKTMLLDQTIVAGLGNIYVCEALYRAGIHPETTAGAVTLPSCTALAFAIRTVLAEALEAGGSSLRDYAGSDGAPGYFQHRFDVYDRESEACLRPGCDGTIRRLKQAGRSSFFCPACQK